MGKRMARWDGREGEGVRSNVIEGWIYFKFQAGVG
jgi:hypothetical protein